MLFSDTRNRIIHVAAEWVWCMGACQFTVDQLAESLHISKKSIYRYFPSRRQLVYEAVQWLLAQQRTQLESIHSSATDTFGEILACQDYWCSCWKTVCQNYFQDMKEACPNAFILQVCQIRHLLSTLLERGIEENVFWPDMKVDITCHWGLKQYMHTFGFICFPEFTDFSEERLVLANQLLYGYRHFFLGICTHGAHAKLSQEFGLLPEC